MKIKGRKQSKNVEDRTAYFGSDSLDPDYTRDDREADFLADSILTPYLTAKPDTFSTKRLSNSRTLKRKWEQGFPS